MEKLKVTRECELTKAGQYFIMIGGIFTILGLLLTNYLLIIPGLFFLLLITTSFIHYFRYPVDDITIEMRISKEYIRNKGLMAVVVVVKNPSKRTIYTKVNLHFSYHFQCIDSPESFHCKLPANKIVQHGWYLLATRRGNAIIGPISLSYGPFHTLIRNKIVLDERKSVKILPMRPKIHVPWKTKKDLLLKMVNEFAQRTKGLGDEYHSLRDYQLGDSIRHIDWYATARRDALITKEFEDLRNLHFLVFLDVSSTMFGPKFDYALSSVVELCSLIKGTQHDLAVVAYSSKVERFIIPQIGINELRLMLNLYDLEATGTESNFLEAVKFVQHQQLQHSIAIIFSDLDGDLNEKTKGLELLRFLGSRVIYVNFSTTAFNILADKTFGSDSINYEYSEILETVFPSLVKDEYKKRELQVKKALFSVGGDYTLIDGYLDNVILALYRLMKKYSPTMRIFRESQGRLV